MTSFRALLSLACGAALFAASPAAASSVVVARLEASGADAAQAGKLDASLRAQARQVVGDRLSSAAPSRPDGCAGDQACAAALAATHGAGSVVLSSYQASGGRHELRVRLHDGSGKLVATAQRSLGALPDGRVLRGALAELLNPAAYVGRLRVRNAPSGAQVKVDHLPLSTAEVLEPYALSVGTHVVEVSAPEHTTLVREVAIAYDEELALDATLAPVGDAAAPAPAPAVAAEAVPWWPAAVTGTVAAVAGVAAIVAGVDWATTGYDVAVRNGQLQNADANLDPHHYAASLLPRGVDDKGLPLLRAAVRTDMVIVTVAGSIAVLAGAATGALAARWATAEEPAEPEAAAPAEEAP